MSASKRLSGWKEIAGYVGRSVRSVQRWEQELGFPIRRLKTLNGQTVFAETDEIDHWLSRVVTPPPEPDEADVIEEEAPPLADSPSTVDTPPPARQARPRVLVMLAVALFSFALGWWTRPLGDTKAVSIRVINQGIEGVSASGAVLWRDELGMDVSRLSETSRWRAEPPNLGFSDVDLNGDGDPDHVVPVRIMGDHATKGGDAVFAYSSDGRRLWALHAPPIFACGDQQHLAPWYIKSIIVSRSPGPRRLWVAFIHDLAWPSFVIEVNADGQQRMVYSQRGWIMDLHEWSVGGRRMLAAGGVINAERRPSLVFFDPDGEDATEPPPLDVTCSDDEVQPEQVWLFPSLELWEAYRVPYGLVSHLKDSGAHLRLDFMGFAHVHVSTSGEAMDYTLTDIYLEEHARAVKSGVVPHPVEQSELAHPKEIRRWSRDKGWVNFQLMPKTFSP